MHYVRETQESDCFINKKVYSEMTCYLSSANSAAAKHLAAASHKSRQYSTVTSAGSTYQNVPSSQRRRAFLSSILLGTTASFHPALVAYPADVEVLSREAISQVGKPSFSSTTLSPNAGATCRNGRDSQFTYKCSWCICLHSDYFSSRWLDSKP